MWQGITLLHDSYLNLQHPFEAWMVRSILQMQILPKIKHRMIKDPKNNPSSNLMDSNGGGKANNLSMHINNDVVKAAMDL